ncbi:MAG: transporter substrate-binding domain-containing protein [Desulfocapsa sp.]|nr:transporter substrate-binding domain-containing protein [Desulfocapsa sp.]
MIKPKLFFTSPPFLLVWIVALLMSACTSADYSPTSSTKVAPDPSILRIGVSANAPPLIYKKNDKIIGLEADFARKLARYTGKKAKFVEIKWSDQIDALENNEIDIIMSSMNITPPRAYRIAFSNPYLRSGQILLVRLEEKARFATGIYSLMNSNYVIGIIKDTTGDLFITRSINGAKSKTFTKSADAVQALLDKKIDAFVYDAPMVCYYAAINENAKLAPILNLATEEYLAWGIRKEDSKLLAQANQFLQELEETEQLQQMIRAWIPYM